MDIGDTILTQRHGQALWRTFLIVAIILFMIESYLSRPRPDAIKNKTMIENPENKNKKKKHFSLV